MQEGEQMRKDQAKIIQIRALSEAAEALQAQADNIGKIVTCGHPGCGLERVLEPGLASNATPPGWVRINCHGCPERTTQAVRYMWWGCSQHRRVLSKALGEKPLCEECSEVLSEEFREKCDCNVDQQLLDNAVPQ